MPDTDPDKPEEPSELPEESVGDLIQRISDEARKKGLYFLNAAVHEDATPEEEREGDPLHHRLIMQFTIGDIAFADRVQNPDEESMKDKFREIETATIEEQIEEIRRLHRKPKA